MRSVGDVTALLIGIRCRFFRETRIKSVYSRATALKLRFRYVYFPAGLQHAMQLARIAARRTGHRISLATALRREQARRFAIYRHSELSLKRCWREQHAVSLIRRWSSPIASANNDAPPSQADKKKDDGYSWVPYTVLLIIGSLVAWFWRASKAQSNRAAQLAAVEAEQELDLKERLELRERNGASLSASIFDDVALGCVRDLGALETDCAYTDFVRVVSRYIEKPIEAAHYLDRVVLKHASLTQLETMPLGFFMAVLALAMGGSPDERATALAHLVASDEGKVARADAVRLLEWLTLAGHVPPSALVFETPKKYPVQEYSIRTPSDLLDVAADAALRPEDRCANELTKTQLATLLQSKTIKIS